MGALVCACSGEAATEDFGNGYPGGSQPPPASQQGEATPTPNFPDCPECSNACLACIEAAGEDEIEGIKCITGSACQAYLAEFIDSVGEYGSSGNILATPEGEPPEGDECLDVADDDCLYCQCLLGEQSDTCTALCQ